MSVPGSFNAFIGTGNEYKGVNLSIGDLSVESLQDAENANINNLTIGSSIDDSNATVFLAAGDNVNVNVDGKKRIAYNGSGTATLKSTINAENNQTIDIYCGINSQIVIDNTGSGQKFNMLDPSFTSISLRYNVDRAGWCRARLANGEWTILTFPKYERIRSSQTNTLPRVPDISFLDNICVIGGNLTIDGLGGSNNYNGRVFHLFTIQRASLTCNNDSIASTAKFLTSTGGNVTIQGTGDQTMGYGIATFFNGAWRLKVLN